MNHAGERIKECRLNARLTQEEVAKELGISKQAVYKYETGIVTNIPLENLEKMAIMFNISPCYLAGWGSEDEKDKVSMVVSSEEEKLVISYRGAEPPIRRAAMKMLEDSAEERAALRQDSDIGKMA